MTALTTPPLNLGNDPSTTPLRFERGLRIHDAGTTGFPWRIVSGVVRFDIPGDEHGERSFAGLAMEGDLVGSEVLMFGRFAYRATALTPCELEPWPGQLLPDNSSLLQALTRSEQRAAAVVALRSGQAMARVCRLIGLLLPKAAPAQLKTELPLLRDMAEITALTIETVSRTLSGLRRLGVLEPENERRGGGRKACLISTERLATV